MNYDSSIRAWHSFSLPDKCWTNVDKWSKMHLRNYFNTNRALIKSNKRSTLNAQKKKKKRKKLKNAPLLQTLQNWDWLGQRHDCCG